MREEKKREREKKTNQKYIGGNVTDDFESATFNKLREHQGIRGMAREKHFADSQR